MQIDSNRQAIEEINERTNTVETTVSKRKTLLSSGSIFQIANGYQPAVSNAVVCLGGAYSSTSATYSNLFSAIGFQNGIAPQGKSSRTLSKNSGWRLYASTYDFVTGMAYAAYLDSSTNILYVRKYNENGNTLATAQVDTNVVNNIMDIMASNGVCAVQYDYRGAGMNKIAYSFDDFATIQYDGGGGDSLNRKVCSVNNNGVLYYVGNPSSGDANIYALLPKSKTAQRLTNFINNEKVILFTSTDNSFYFYSTSSGNLFRYTLNSPGTAYSLTKKMPVQSADISTDSPNYGATTVFRDLIRTSNGDMYMIRDSTKMLFFKFSANKYELLDIDSNTPVPDILHINSAHLRGYIARPFTSDVFPVLIHFRNNQFYMMSKNLKLSLCSISDGVKGDIRFSTKGSYPLRYLNYETEYVFTNAPKFMVPIFEDGLHYIST